METYSDAPQVLRNFLSYHETVKGQSRRTVSEYYLDLRMFLRFVRLMREELPYKTPLDDIPIKDLGLDFIRSITTSEVFDFLSYLANDRENPEAASGDNGIGSAARARKLSAIKAFYNYLTVSTKQITENPVKDIEFPKIRKSLPKYLSLDESKTLLKAVQGPNQARDFAILMIFLNCGIRRSELVGLNLTDVYDDRLRVVGKGNKERIVYMGSSCRKAIDRYLIERSQIVLSDNRALFGVTAIASVSPPSTGWSKSICLPQAWIPRSFLRTSFATRRQPSCSRTASISRRFRRCSATKTSTPRRSTPTSKALSSKLPPRPIPSPIWL